LEKSLDQRRHLHCALAPLRSIQPPQGRAKASSGAAPHAALRPSPRSAAARSALASAAPSARERHHCLEIEVEIEREKGKRLPEEENVGRGFRRKGKKGGENKKKGKKERERKKGKRRKKEIDYLFLEK
jgi:hypothetical protein